MTAERDDCLKHSVQLAKGEPCPQCEAEQFPPLWVCKDCGEHYQRPSTAEGDRANWVCIWCARKADERVGTPARHHGSAGEREAARDMGLMREDPAKS
jgi:hypothetical protein